MHASLRQTVATPPALPFEEEPRASRTTATPPVLLVPGLGDSGPDHWQSLWRRARPSFRRVVQDDFDVPDLGIWAAAVARAIDAARKPPIVVAHGFGCLAAIHAATFYRRRLAGALLVAPSDPQRWRVSPLLSHARLPFRATLVASTNDPLLAHARAAAFADVWGARLVTLPDAGHINADSGVGAWPQGLELLAELAREPADSETCGTA